MSYENIRFTQPAFCAAGNYFLSMQPDPVNMLIQKTSNGDPAMAYPFSNAVIVPGNAFLSIQYDGVNIWTLEKANLPAGVDIERILRRWRIQNYICVLQDSWELRPQGMEAMNGKAFAIENYWNVLAVPCGVTQNTDRLVLNYPTAAYFQVTDQVYIQSALNTAINQDVGVAATPTSNVVTLTSPLDHPFQAGDPVYLRRSLYYFNNQSPDLGSTMAALYQFSVPYITAQDPTTLNQLNYQGCHESGVYDNVSAATFLTTSGWPGINSGYYTGAIAYVRGAQMLLKKPNLWSGGIPYPGGMIGTNAEFRDNMASMLIDGAFQTDGITLNTIYDMSSAVDPVQCQTINLYRLQLNFTYGSLQGTWSSYNYVTSVMTPMLTSVALTADPALVVANGVDHAIITAVVLDQYGAPLNYKRLVFSLSATDSSQQGYFLCPESISECAEGSFTWLDTVPHAQAEIITGSQSSTPGGPPAMQGQAFIEWVAGTAAGLVTIIATVQP